MSVGGKYIHLTDLILLLNLISNKVVKLIMKLFVYGRVPVCVITTFRGYNV